MRLRFCVAVAAPRLDSETARVEGSGSAEDSAKVSGDLDAQLRGSAELTYTGNPRVRKSPSGSQPGARIAT